MPSFLRRLLCVGLLALSCAAVPPAAQARDDALLAAASAEQDAVLVTLEKLVGIETGTGDAQGLAAIADFLEAQLRALDLDDRARAFRFNWTVGTGGRVANVIPDTVTIEANIRYLDPALLDAAFRTLAERAARPRLAGATIAVERVMGRPSFIADAAGRALIDRARAIYREIGADLAVAPVTGGGTDAAYAAQAGRPVLEALGMPGFGYHSDQAEYVLIDAIPRRLYLAVRMITDVAAGR
jgi:glutamate carboxypeptidase